MTIEHAHAGEVNCVCVRWDPTGVPWWEDDEVVRELNLKEAREWVTRRRSEFRPR